MSKIALIRLVNNTDLITEIISTTSDSILIKKPMAVVVIPPQKLAANQGPKVGFLPWLEFSKLDTVNLDRNHVLCIIDPIDEFVTQYRSMVSPIVPSTTPGLIIP